MSLDFSDFAHYYADSGICEADQRAHFEIYASLMESLVQFFWHIDPSGDGLGISFDNDTMALIGEVESDGSSQTTFNNAAIEKTARKQDS